MTRDSLRCLCDVLLNDLCNKGIFEMANTAISRLAVVQVRNITRSILPPFYYFEALPIYHIPNNLPFLNHVGLLLSSSKLISSPVISYPSSSLTRPLIFILIHSPIPHPPSIQPLHPPPPSLYPHLFSSGESCCVDGPRLRSGIGPRVSVSIAPRHPTPRPPDHQKQPHAKQHRRRG